ncbi:T9SS sorting signal type C domain-containing protein, partial [Moheibacter sediminis]
YTSVGNPYPSNIDSELFMSANGSVSTLYFWNNTGQAGMNYATYTTLGGSPAGGGSETPTDFISVGQGFLVESSSSSVTFNNEMRVSDATIFFKESTVEKHRFWLSLNNESNQNLNNILVGYMSGATQGVDNQIDGKQFASQGSALYSIISEEKFAIQGRALPFENTDVVTLGFQAAEAGKFNISLSNFDGLFTEGEVTVYLKDRQLDIIHNLMESSYTFESAAGEFKERFEVVYQTEGTMGIGDLASAAVLIYKNNQNIVVESKNEKILSVELFDLSGRNIHSNNKVNANTYQIKSNAQGVLVVKVQTQNGEVVTKKVINK